MSMCQESSGRLHAQGYWERVVIAAMFACIAVSLSACAPERSNTSRDAELNATENAEAAAEQAVEEAAAAVANTAPAITSVAETGWAYNISEDEMTGKPIRSACVTSENEVDLPWPYGPTRGRLCLRNHPQFGRDAYVSLVGDGQILCPSYDGCELSVRFDNAEPQTFSGAAPDDHSSDMVFFSDYERPRLEKAVARAKVTRVQLEFYQAGSQAFRFDTSGFNWPAAAKPRPSASASGDLNAAAETELE